MNSSELKRYNRHIILPEIGLEGQQKLKDAKVLVIGAGGLGCPVLLYLTAAGVGEIGIIDDDKVDETNLQRQVLYTTADVGRYKTDAAIEKLLLQNPYISPTGYKERLSANNAVAIIAKYDIVVDGSDNFATRYLVNDACVMLNKPFVFGSIFKFEGQVSVFNYAGGPTYRCLYAQPPALGEAPSCTDIGVLGVLPGITGALQANEVIKLITGIGELLSGKVLCFDALSMNFSTFAFHLVPENKLIKSLGNYEQFCGAAIKEISPEELKSKIEHHEKFQLIDVREKVEYENWNIGGELIPLRELPANLNKISKNQTVIIHCQSGVRSRKAAEILVGQGIADVCSVKGTPII